jgi:hypothetical protein
MRTYRHTVFAILDTYDIFYGGQKSDAGVDFYIDMYFPSLQRCETCSQ